MWESVGVDRDWQPSLSISQPQVAWNIRVERNRFVDDLAETGFVGGDIGAVAEHRLAPGVQQFPVIKQSYFEAVTTQRVDNCRRGLEVCPLVPFPKHTVHAKVTNEPEVSVVIRRRSDLRRMNTDTVPVEAVGKKFEVRIAPPVEKVDCACWCSRR